MKDRRENPEGHRAVVVIDAQYDFIPELDEYKGRLPVPKAEETIPIIEQMCKTAQKKGTKIFFSQDWHDIDHDSFAYRHGKQAFSDVQLGDTVQTGWPLHCVKNTKGAEIVNSLKPYAENSIIVQKGWRRKVDSYSAFLENDKKHKTSLEAWLKFHNITKLTLTGLATDFCVGFTALDARNLTSANGKPYEVEVITDACRGISMPLKDGPASDTLAAMELQLDKAGVAMPSLEKSKFKETLLVV